MISEEGAARADVVLKGGKDSSVTLENVPVEILQAMYREITGKTEKISKYYAASIELDIDTISQLFYRVTQTINQFGPIERSETITVNHLGDDKLTFSSFERFRLYDTNKRAPIAAILISFNILIRSAQTEKPYNYKLTVRFLPFVLKEAEQEGLSFRYLIGPYAERPLYAEIEYVDYVVARSVISAVDEWVNSIKNTENSPISDWFIKHQEKFEPIIIGLGVIASIFAIISLAPNYTANIPENFHLFGKYILFGIVWVIITYLIYAGFASHIVLGWYNYRKISFSMINKGDRDNKNSSLKIIGRHKKYTVAFLIAASVHMAVDIFSKFIFHYMRII